MPKRLQCTRNVLSSLENGRLAGHDDNGLEVWELIEEPVKALQLQLLELFVGVCDIEVEDDGVQFLSAQSREEVLDTMIHRGKMDSQLLEVFKGKLRASVSSAVQVFT